MKLIVEKQDWAAMPTLEGNFPLAPYSEATATTPSRSTNTNYEYNADIKRDWCIGLVPHGGYLMSVVAEGVHTHFKTQHATLNQPDLITFHVEFLSRTNLGPATLSIHPLKLGRQFSTVRVQLLQHDEKSNKPRLCLEALVTQGNLVAESQNGGMALPTLPVLDKASIPRREDCEPYLVEEQWLLARPAAFKIAPLFPPGSDSLGASPTYGPSVKEEWVRWAPGVGTSFSVASLPYLADAFRPLPEAYGLVGNWYPTLNYGMDVKRAPPKNESGEVGWEWLFLKVEMHEVRNGRFDLDVVIADEEGNVVATSRHVALIVGAERNYKGRVDQKAKI